MATPTTFLDIVATLNTANTALQNPPDVIRLTSDGTTTIDITDGTTTLHLITLDNGYPFPNDAVYDPVAKTFNVTGYADSCTIAYNVGNFIINVSYTSTAGATSEQLYMSSQNFEHSISYTDIDTLYKMNNNTVTTVSSIVDPFMNRIDFTLDGGSLSYLQMRST